MAGNDIGTWFQNIPMVTKYWFSGSIILPLAGRFGLVSYFSMILDYVFISRFQIWRGLTGFLYYPISPSTGFHWMIMLYFLYSYSTRLETGVYAGKPADYVFLIIFNWLTLLIVGLILNLPLLFDPMVMSVLYIWCQLNRDTIVSFWFGTQFKAMYLPWVLFAFNMILGGGGFTELLGILAGHLYFFITFKYPQDFGGRQLVSTPSILYRWFPNHSGISGFGVAPAARRQPGGDQDGGGGRHNWGRGNQLGGN